MQTRFIVMELREFISFLFTYNKHIGLVAILAAVFGFGLALLVPHQFVAITDIYVYRAPLESNENYTFEGYYTQQSSKELADTLVGFLTSIHTAETVLRAGNFEGDSGANAYKLAKGVEVSNLATNVLRLTLKRSTSEEAKTLSNMLLKEALTSLEAKTQVASDSVRISALGEPLVREVSYSPYLWAGASGLLGVLLTILALSLRAYFHGNWEAR